MRDRLMGVFLGALGLLMLQPASQPQAAESPAPEGRLSPPRAQARFITEVTPKSPCLGQRVTVVGKHYTGATRVVVWITRARSRSPAMPYLDSYPANVDRMNDAVRVAEATVDGNGAFETSFILQPRLSPVDGGGSIVLEPGYRYYVAVKNDARIDRKWSEQSVPRSDCPPVAGPVPPPLRVVLDPPELRTGSSATLSGSGFEGPKALLTMGEVQHRFGHGMYASREIPVGRDGQWRLEFKPEDFFPNPAGHNVMWVEDPVTQRSQGVPVILDIGPVKQALQAPSIAFVQSLVGQISVRQKRRPQNEFDSAIIRRPSDFEAIALSHGLPHDTFAQLPAIDFQRHLGLFVLSVWSGAPQNIEISAVEPGSAGLTVRSIRQISFSPGVSRHVFHLVTIPRTDLPIAFASPVPAPPHMVPSLRPPNRPRNMGYIDLPGRRKPPSPKP